MVGLGFEGDYVEPDNGLPKHIFIVHLNLVSFGCVVLCCRISVNVSPSLSLSLACKTILFHNTVVSEQLLCMSVVVTMHVYNAGAMSSDTI